MLIRVTIVSTLLWGGVGFAAGRLAVDLQQRSFSFTDGRGTGLHRARFALEVDEKTLWAESASGAKWDGPQSGEILPGQAGRLELRFDDAGVLWIIKVTGGSSPVISSTIQNTGRRAIRLGRCRLADLSGGASEVRLGPEADRSTLLVMSGWQGGPSQVRRLRAQGKRHLSKTLSQIYNPGARVALQLGFLSFDRVSTAHEIWWDEQRNRAGASSYCDFEGFTLPAGASKESETLRLDLSSDPYASLYGWADAVNARYQPRIWPKIPAGWVGWSWVDGFNVEKYEDVVLRNAKAIRDRLPGFDIGYLWVSIGNLEGRQPGNWLRWNRELFPSGPQKLVEELGRLNFSLGLWSGAFWLSSRLQDQVAQFDDALLMRGGNRLTIPHRDLGAVYALDPTHPKTKARLKEVFSTYRDWGIRYYMIDFLDAVSGSTPGTHRPDGYFDKSIIPSVEAYREGLKVIREAAGPETYLLASTGPTLQNIGLIDGCRVGTDYGEGRALDGPGKGFYPGTFVINRPDYWTSHRKATDALATHFFTHRKLFLADSGNVLTIDKPVPLSDAQISATIFGINGGPVMLGDDISRMTDERLQMVKQLFPRLPEAAMPLDLFETPVPDYPKVFGLKARGQWDAWDLVAVFNYQNKTLAQKIEFSRLDLPGNQPYLVWDFWNERYLGVHTGSLDLNVPPQSVRLLRIARRRGHPWVASTDMHIRQGQAEIEACRWDEAKMELTVEARRPAQQRGNVFVHVPKGLALKNPAGLWIGKDGNDNSLVVRVAMDFPRGETVRRTLSFVNVPGQ